MFGAIAPRTGPGAGYGEDSAAEKLFADRFGPSASNAEPPLEDDEEGGAAGAAAMRAGRDLLFRLCSEATPLLLNLLKVRDLPSLSYSIFYFLRCIFFKNNDVFLVIRDYRALGFVHLLYLLYLGYALPRIAPG